jgi:hypothetical protein
MAAVAGGKAADGSGCAGAALGIGVDAGPGAGPGGGAPRGLAQPPADVDDDDDDNDERSASGSRGGGSHSAAALPTLPCSVTAAPSALAGGAPRGGLSSAVAPGSGKVTGAGVCGAGVDGAAPAAISALQRALAASAVAAPNFSCSASHKYDSVPSLY